MTTEELPLKECRTCAHYLYDYGECRRYPPTVLIYADGGAMTLFPSPMPDHWCGEWEKKP